MKLSCIRKKGEAKCFQIKTISKGVRKTIVPSLMFLFNLSKSFVKWGECLLFYCLEYKVDIAILWLLAKFEMI